MADRDGPSKELLAGKSPIRIAKRLVLATRPMFFSVSIIPVLLGTAWGVQIRGELDFGAFIVALITIIFVHASINVINDVYDDIIGTDSINEGRIYPFTGGSRFIQNGILDRKAMLQWGILLLTIGSVSGSLLALMKAPEVIIFGLIGACLGVAYSVPPLQLGARGLGELAVGIGFGLTPIYGSAWLQSGIIDSNTLCIAIPISCWVFNILLINEIPDAKADVVAGKRTLVVRFGISGTQKLYIATNFLAFLTIGLAVLTDLLPSETIILPMVLVFAAFYVTWSLTQEKRNRGLLITTIKFTLAIHTLGGIWLTLFIII
ncbi:MAG: prenyltransferase [Rhizobiaceae bacterium]